MKQRTIDNLERRNEVKSTNNRTVPEDVFKKNSAQDLGKSVTLMTEVEPVKAKNKEELVAERSQKLKEIEAIKEKKTAEIKKDSSTTGVMKDSVSRAQKLLATFQEEALTPPSKKKSGSKEKERQVLKPCERRSSEKSEPQPATKTPTRRPLVCFLEEEAKHDEVNKKEIHLATADGYKTVKKMSVHTVDYSVMSQDFSMMPVPNAKPLNYQGIKPKKQTGKRKKLRWRDENGMDTLVDIKFIDANNKGRKCGNPGKRKSNHLVDMNQNFKKTLEWKCVWLEEQKKMKGNSLKEEGGLTFPPKKKIKKNPVQVQKQKRI